MEELRLLAAVILILSGLDFCGLLSAAWPGWGALCLGLSGHWLLLGRLAGPETGWMLAAGAVYYLVRLCWKPLDAQERQRLPGQARAMLAGRRALGGGLAALLSQPFWYWAGWRAGLLQNQSWKLLLADGLLALSAAALPALWGAGRALLRSRRLGVWKRAAALWLLWIPLVNLPIFWYMYRKTGEEYRGVLCRAELDRLRDETSPDLCALRYPLILVHGIGFRDLKYFNYWGRIPGRLARYGGRVWYGCQQAWGTIENNAAALKQTVCQVMEQTGCQKVNIIAHSKGGLDARWMISHLNMGGAVASLTTIATPHRGSELLDLLCRLPDPVYRLITRQIDRVFAKVGDPCPDAYHASRQLSPAFCAQFNEQTPDDPRVYYQSYAAAMGGFSSDFLLSIPWLLLRLTGGENDGLVCVPSAQWGKFRGVLRGKNRRGISHGDLIDLKRQDYQGFDALEIYINIAAELKQMGF